MKKIDVVITDPVGIHARPASLMAKEANKYKSKITLTYNDKLINLKSVLNVMASAIKYQAHVSISFEGEDEEQACNNFEAFLKNHKII